MNLPNFFTNVTLKKRNFSWPINNVKICTGDFKCHLPAAWGLNCY